MLNPKTEEEQKPLYKIASNHMARRTLVGNLYKKVKDQSLVGHSSITSQTDQKSTICPTRYSNIGQKTTIKLTKSI